MQIDLILSKLTNDPHYSQNMHEYIGVNAVSMVYRVGSGFRFNCLGVWFCNKGFTGLEFAGGILSIVGGATCMNAGANGQVIP
jgi:UDP-N-acetylenolpyruvoylglucosamine reductase